MSFILCVFSKAHNTQYAIFKELHFWQKELDQKRFVGTSLIDLSNALDCIPNDILIVNLDCYGIDKIVLSFIFDYFSHRKERTKVRLFI